MFVEGLALARALLTKALALDAAVGGAVAVAGGAEVEGNSEAAEPLLAAEPCRHAHTLSVMSLKRARDCTLSPVVSKTERNFSAMP